MDEKARNALEEQSAQVAYLRATGPNPFEYFLWADKTSAIVHAIFGDGSAEAISFDEAVRQRGRTIDQRGLYDNMTLGLHGEWGIWARLDRAQGVLEQIVQRSQAAAGR